PPFLSARRDVPPPPEAKPADARGGLQLDALAAERLARRRAGEACLQAEDRLRVQLRDARLGHAEHLADLAQRQLLVVVERHDELLALGQPRDRLADRLAQLGRRERAL